MSFKERALGLRRAVILVICFLPMACSKSHTKVYPVSGEVFFNGQPAAGAVVHFHPVDVEHHSPAFATVKDDGSFQMSTFGTDDGAEVGDYVVTIYWRDQVQGEGEMISGPDHLGERYSNPKTSKLTASVIADENMVERFDLRG